MSYTYRDRDRDWDEPRSSASVKRYVIPPEDERNLVVRRPADWDNHSGSVSRYERDLDYDSRHHDRGSYEREYSEPYSGYHRYARPEQTPIPIIISNGQPIIIYEARGAVYPRDSDYDFVDRDPGYYYHRRARDYDDDRDRHLRREVSPADSISQAGRGRRHRDRDYSSDDSMVYVRRGSREREEHPHHRRHMAEGALVGVGAAELIRNRRKNTGDEVSGGVGRIGQDVGAGALGAVAVEAGSRARDYYRSRSRPRAHSRSNDDDDRSSNHGHYSHRRRHRSHGHRSRSRARSHSRTKTLAGLGIGAAAIAAGVALANKNHGKSYDERRSRSRHRRHRSSRRSTSEDGEVDDHHRSESQRRKHMAGAGVAGAAAAGLIDRARSRSHSRSHSKIRQALPIVAGGLGAAGVTGLYEKNKEKKDDERSRHRERRHRSRSLSRTPSDVYPDPSRDSNNLIEYGDRPVHGSIPAADYYGRSPTPPGYFSDATDPVASDAAGYGSSRRRDRSRNRSRSRPGSSSDSSSDSDRGSRPRRRSRHGKSKKVAGAALASAGVGYAAHKYSQHKDRRSPGADRDKLRELPKLWKMMRHMVSVN